MTGRDHDMPDLDPDLDLAPPCGPDLAPAIMRRLGYAPCSAAERRRQRRRQSFRAAGLLVALAAVLGVGLSFYRAHLAVRTPVGPTIPAALRHDLERQHERVDAAFRTLRRLRPAAPPAAPPPEQVDPKAMAPVRWL